MKDVACDTLLIIYFPPEYEYRKTRQYSRHGTMFPAISTCAASRCLRLHCKTCKRKEMLAKEVRKRLQSP